MSIEEVKRFNQDVQNSDEMRDKVLEMGTDVQAVIEFGKEAGYDFDKQDLTEYAAEMTAPDEGDRELCDSELDEVAGGLKAGVVAKAITQDGVLVYGVK